MVTSSRMTMLGSRVQLVLRVFVTGYSSPVAATSILLPGTTPLASNVSRAYSSTGQSSLTGVRRVSKTGASSETGQTSSEAGQGSQQRARSLTLATAAATAALGSFYLLYRQKGVKADGSVERTEPEKVSE